MKELKKNIAETCSEAHPAPSPMSTGVKWLGREADHSPRASAEVKKTWICTSIYPYVFMALVLC
jgi:hypothetical protein